MSRYLERYLFTLEEVVEYVYGASKSPYDTITFKNVFYELFSSSPVFDSSGNTISYVEDLFQLVYARFSNHYMIDTTEEELDDTLVEKALTKFVNIILMNYDRYKVIFKIYQDNINDMLPAINSVSVGIARFNDTPQGEESGDEYEDHDHTTNITKSKATTESDGTTLMNRLKELQDSYANLMKDFSDKFAELFLEEGNYEY